MTALDPDFLSGLPGAVCSEIAAAMPDLRECVPHPGGFSAAELKRFVARAPGVRVALLGLGRGREIGGPEWVHDLRFAAFVVTRDQAGLGRDAAALAIVQRLAVLVHGNRWQQSELGAATGLDAQNLYGAALRDLGVSLWAVGWTQPVQFRRDPAALDPLPSTLYARGLEPDGQPHPVEAV